MVRGVELVGVWYHNLSASPLRIKRVLDLIQDLERQLKGLSIPHFKFRRPALRCGVKEQNQRQATSVQSTPWILNQVQNCKLKMWYKIG